MNFVGARFQDHIFDAAGHEAKFRVIGAGDDFELLYRVNRRNISNFCIAGVVDGGRGVRYAIQHQCGVARAAAVDREICLGIVEWPLPLYAASPQCAGIQDRQHAGIASVQRQLSNTRVFDHFADIRFAGVEYRVGVHSDGFGITANFQAEVYCRCLIHVQNDSSMDAGFKTGRFNRYGIVTCD